MLSLSSVNLSKGIPTWLVEIVLTWSDNMIIKLNYKVKTIIYNNNSSLKYFENSSIVFVNKQRESEILVH